MSTRAHKELYDDEKKHDAQRIRDLSREDSPSSTQISAMDVSNAPTSTTTRDKMRRANSPSNGRGVSYRRSRSTDSSSSYEGANYGGKRSSRRSHSSDRYDKTKVSTNKPYNKRDYDYATTSSSRNQKKPAEKLPYFADAKREEDRLRRKYGRPSPSRSRRRSSSRTRKRSRTRSYSRDRHRSRYRTSSRERRRSSSYDRYRSRRRSRTPTRHQDSRSSMMQHGAPAPYIPIVPFQYPYPPQFVTAPYGPRFPPDGVMRPQFPPPPMVVYVPQPIIRHMGGRWMNRPIRPRRNH